MISRHNLFGRAITTVACVGLFVTAAGRARSEASSKPEAKPSIQFLSDKDIESSFTLEELLHGTARLVVRNDLATDQKLGVTFSPLIALGGAEPLPTPEPATPLLLIEGPKIIKAHARASFALSVDPNAGSQLCASGTYGGVITLVSDQPKAVPAWRRFSDHRSSYTTQIRRAQRRFGLNPASAPSENSVSQN